MKNKTKDKINNWIVIRDNVCPEKCFDESNGGLSSAENYLQYCQRNYLGSFRILSLTDKEFRKFFNSREKLTSDINIARSARSLTR